MKVLVITGDNTFGKSYLIWHMRQRCKMLMLEQSLSTMNAWHSEQTPVDAVVLDRLGHAPNLIEIVSHAAKWCKSNDTPFIVVGQPGSALEQVMSLLPEQQVVLHLVRNLETNLIRASIGQQTEVLSVDSLLDKVFALVGIEISGQQLSKNF
ncbi:hypothetical protein ACWAUP_000348 [Pseudomonas aeruginosa]